MSNCGAHVVALGVAVGVALFAFAERFSPVPVPVPVVSKGIRLLSFMSFITVCSVAAFMPLPPPPLVAFRFIQSLDISGALSFLERRSLRPLCVLPTARPACPALSGPLLCSALLLFV